MAHAPTLVARPDMAPVPRVEIVFPTVVSGAERATVYRISGARSYGVRAGVNIYAAGGFTLPPDTEVPFNIPVTYRAEFFNAAGVSLGFSDGATVTVPFAGTVFHQPVTPSRAVGVTLLNGAAGDLSRPFRGELVQPLGRSVPVWIGSGRSGLVAVDLSSATMTAEDEAAFQSVFGGYDDVQLPVVCFRTSEPTGLPQPFFGVIRDPRRIGFDTHLGGETVTWTLSADEAAPPVNALVMSLLRYSDLEAVAPTYSALEAAYLTYLGMESDYSIAGTA